MLYEHQLRTSAPTTAEKINAVFGPGSTSKRTNERCGFGSSASMRATRAAKICLDREGRPSWTKTLCAASSNCTQTQVRATWRRHSAVVIAPSTDISSRWATTEPMPCWTPYALTAPRPVDTSQHMWISAASPELTRLFEGDCNWRWELGLLR